MKLGQRFAVGTGLLAAQIPFIVTRHVQEDAYITFRCAANLVATGIYGYNPGERASASTSHLAVFTVALIRLAAGQHFIVATQMLYGIATLVGLYLIAAAVVRDTPSRIWVWAAIGLFPVSLTVAYSGMETALVMLLTGTILRSTYEPWPTTWTLAAFFLLPWARPDAVALGIVTILSAGAFGKQSMRPVITYSVYLMAGSISWLVFNRLYFGAFLPQSIHGKAIMWMPSTWHDAVLGGAMRLRQVFLGQSMWQGIFTPIATRHLKMLAVPAFVVVAAAAIAVTARPAKFAASRRAAVALAGIAFVMPVAYAVGGVLAPWYFWPSAVAGWLLVVVAGVASIRPLRGVRQHLACAAAAIVLVSLMVGQWLYAASWGTQEHFYRGGIGDEIRTLASPGDTLLLEPAGYVPFHAQLWTWDEIGITSPVVTEYRSNYGPAWWIRFIHDRTPTFLLERDHILANRTLDGYDLSTDEQAWFATHYALVRVFTYEPDRLRSARLMLFAARLGSARDYYLYRRIDRPLP